MPNKTRTSTAPYETSDLYFAAFLKTAGVTMKAPRWVDDRKSRCFFVFEDDGQGTIERLSLEWVNDSKYRGFSENVKALKQLCHF